MNHVIAWISVTVYNNLQKEYEAVNSIQLTGKSHKDSN